MKPFATTILLAGIAATIGGCGIGNAQQQLRSAVDAKSQELDQCYADALTRDRDAAGFLNAYLHVDTEEGRIREVEFTSGDVNDPALQSCMSTTLTQVRLAEPPAANLKVEYTFQLTPQG
jgi:hypothetical protein